MKILKYGFIQEDHAQAKFLEEVLAKILDYCDFSAQFTFQKDEEYFNVINANLKRKYPNRKEILDNSRNIVDSNYIVFIVQGLIQYEQDIFFVIRDVDDDKFEKLEEMFNQRIQKIKGQDLSTDKIIIVLPIFCIETWYMYEKWRRKKHQDQVLEDKFESIGRKVKSRLHNKKSSEDTMEILSDLAKYLDVDFLARHSDSFKHFINQMKDYLNKNELKSKND